MEQQGGQAQGQPPPVEEALLDDAEHGSSLEQQEAAPPGHLRAWVDILPFPAGGGDKEFLVFLRKNNEILSVRARNFN